MLDILLDNPNFVAISKPANLAVIPGRAEETSALEELAQQLNLPHTGTADPRLRVVHRLDKETSGVLLFAKDLQTQRHLSHQFQNNTVSKEYLALVAGRVKDEEATIDAPLAPHPSAKTRMHVSKHGRPAVTQYKIEQRFRDYTLLRCFPQDGEDASDPSPSGPHRTSSCDRSAVQRSCKRRTLSLRVQAKLSRERRRGKAIDCEADAACAEADVRRSGRWSNHC